MRMPWQKSRELQLDLLGDDSPQPSLSVEPVVVVPATTRPGVTGGSPLMLRIEQLVEDAGNPRTEFPEAQLDELAEDIRQHGILQPIVVHPADAQGRHRIHFGAKRWRAARRAGLLEVPVVVRAEAADPYLQVAENQRRHGLSALDLARFIRGRADAGESHAQIAKRLAMDLTSIAHHLTLLELPAEVQAAMNAGRCTAPRTLHELSKLHREAPERAQELLAGHGDITRAALKSARSEAPGPKPRRAAPASAVQLRLQAEAACTRLELALDRLAHRRAPDDQAKLDDLKARLAALAGRLA